MSALPADIEHILSLGANEKDPAEEDGGVGREGTSNYERVVREMREKAGFGTKEEGKDGLEGIEKEMEESGVKRGAGEEVVEQEDGMEGVEKEEGDDR